MVETKIYLLDGHDCVRAAEAGKSHLIKRLLDNREPIDIADERKWTPLHYAASFAQENCVLHLLAKGANPSARTDKGWTPLHRAVHSGHSTVCNLLLEAGTDVNAENTAGETALHMAAAANNVPLVEQLLEHNADPSLRDMAGRNVWEYTKDGDGVRSVIEHAVDEWKAGRIAQRPVAKNLGHCRACALHRGLGCKGYLEHEASNLCRLCGCIAAVHATIG
mmetsp:Transcript_35603/g.82781  ORF Transcript_35603/g.82781 Transcript_35603/m.82781 type:complete len:221 (-) Transcript_35603:81-743(-)